MLDVCACVYPIPVTCACVHVGVWEYIQNTRDIVRDLEQRVQLAKSNVEAINKLLSKLCQKPLYQRKDDKKDCLLNLEVIDAYFISVYNFTCMYHTCTMQQIMCCI